MPKIEDRRVRRCTPVYWVKVGCVEPVFTIYDEDTCQTWEDMEKMKEGKWCQGDELVDCPMYPRSTHHNSGILYCLVSVSRRPRDLLVHLPVDGWSL